MGNENVVTRELFGGAVRLSIPERMVDVSDFRPVPDYQEVYTDVNQDQSLVVEVMEYQRVPDESAAQHHFEDLARSNESPHTSVDSVVRLHPSDYPLLPVDHISSVWVLTGQQTSPKGRRGALNKIHLLLCLLRLEKYGVDLLISLNTPIFVSLESAAADTVGAGYHSLYLNAPALLSDILKTLEIISMKQIFQLESYSPPVWASSLSKVPTSRYVLGLLPTPIHKWEIAERDDLQFFIKRDDLSGMELSGNKVRKLEFLMAEAVSRGCDSVVTVGGIQSNHCRATAMAAKYLGLDAHLILRTSSFLVDKDPGLVGNLLLERLIGSHIHLVTKEEYSLHGSQKLGLSLVAQLEEKGKKPYFIPVGGSNALGCWGYVHFVEELRSQILDKGVTDLIVACGSGGTVAGIALGNWLSNLNLKIHAYGVCDTPEYFKRYIGELLGDLGMSGDSSKILESVRLVQARGAGYAISKTEELELLQDIALKTGIVLDPVYTGKAIFRCLRDIREGNPESWKGKTFLFIHTGGLLGTYEKVDELQSIVDTKRCSRMIL